MSEVQPPLLAQAPKELTQLAAGATQRGPFQLQHTEVVPDHLPGREKCFPWALSFMTHEIPSGPFALQPPKLWMLKENNNIRKLKFWQ